ncbi:hypothetical protein DsansV1_C10g0097631 [Dioscorea sansibarensis]
MIHELLLSNLRRIFIDEGAVSNLLRISSLITPGWFINSRVTQ